ncbi:MAG: energy transducer TonB [Nitrospirota bacterium]
MFSRFDSRKVLIISLVISLALHIVMIGVMLFILKKEQPSDVPLFTPVDIVNLPRQSLQKLPPVAPPPPVIDRMPDRLPPDKVPSPKKFGTSDDVRLPKVLPRMGKPEGSDQGKDDGRKVPQKPSDGPLPFLTQRDIDELARKGMPERKPGDDSITLDTDEYKFISYNRWLKIKVESVLKYPELAAVSGYQGTLYIKFDILKNGSLGNLELLKSSGYKILDDEALRAIRDSAPFQPLPSEWNMDRYPIRAAVIFYLGVGYVR